MVERHAEERWLLENSAAKMYENCGEEEDEETLSFCDLPVIRNHSRKENKSEKIENEEEFDFCRSFSKSSEMCAADDVFFQGQILPLRYSVSSEKGLLMQYSGYSRSFSRSESMDHSSYSSGLISSRSSSISSGSSATTATTNRRKHNPKPPRNLFHSHPSPSPRISRCPKKKPVNANPSNTNFVRKSSVWSIFRLGLVAPPPEIAFQCNNNIMKKSFGSRKSTSSNNNSGGGALKSVEKKKKLNAFLVGGGCKCSADAVDTFRSRVVVIKRSATESQVTQPPLEDEEKKVKVMKKQETRKETSHLRTFEWLKQLSLEEEDSAAEEPNRRI